MFGAVMRSVLARIPAFRLGRALGRPLVLPASLTVNLLYACNSRCRTCNIYEQRARVLDPGEYERLFRSLGRAPRWMTFTGGEPFLRPDLGEILATAHAHCRPAVITLPTNGSFPERVEVVVDRIAQLIAPSSLIVNLSIDEVEHAHDALRGLPGNWNLAMRTAELLKRLRQRHPNLVFGINTVVSRFNEHRIDAIANRVEQLEPDSYVAEVAGERVELGTAGSQITPTTEGVLAAIAVLRRRARRNVHMMAALVAALRQEYYRVLARYTTERREILPCYAAITSAHVMPDGKVWACCVLGEELGNLHEVGFDFPTLWYGAAARRIRERIRRERCACTLANQTYLNVLVDPRSLVRVSRRAASRLVTGVGSPAWNAASS
jgi:MoaA/NifB/PqqE/SkfB family radical SAM enzyme